MPQAKELFALVKKEEYQQAIDMLQQNPEMVNCTDEKNGYSFFQLCVGDLDDESSQEFLQYLVTHPQLNFQFQYDNTSNQAPLIASGRMDLIKHVIQKPEFLLLKGNPIYSEALDCLRVLSTAAINRHSRKFPNSPPLDLKGDPEIAALMHIATRIREETIKYAVRNNNADILEQIKKADCEASPSKESDYEPGGCVRELVLSLRTPELIYINQWLEGTYKSAPKVISEAQAQAFFVPKVVKELHQLAKELKDNPALEAWAQLEQAQKELEEKYKKDRTAILTTAIAEGTALLADLKKGLGKP